ncbi:SDR family NAD(P)-dependent oxidoreductase [Cereibacter sphaeroides]|jgi:NAD(P)-dependent dehydrogenase (short-subunit alcohol dehydrogenase family)|uniref:SDR family NAD(P)-dependent oxidoreductase n=1 Tax=Cereibacter sphaeroides TaxID=1063 RepID=UPI00006655AC|nr:short-chain dehydrogenase/reductase SDR [Cereibacter sphaeroides ATCC 17029]
MRSLIVGASGGIGAALLKACGDGSVGVSRRTDGLDVTDEASIARTLGTLEPHFDRVIVATGALEIGGIAPEKSLRAIDGSNLARHFALNAMGPVLVLKHALRLLPRDRPAHFAALSARVGSIGDNQLGGWFAYRAAKAALNQLLHTAAIEVARTHPQAVVVVLHPGTVETGLSGRFRGTRAAVTPQVAAENLLSTLDRLAPSESSGFFDATGARIPW